MVAYPEVLTRGVYTDRAWIGMIALSILCHVLLVSGVVLLPELESSRPHIPSAVMVDLVSLPQGAPQIQARVVAPKIAPKPPPVKRVKATEMTKPERARPEDQLVTMKGPPLKEAVSLAPQHLQVKKSLKKETYNASKVISKAIAKIEKQAPRSRPRPVLQAIDQLKKEVEGGGGVVVNGGAADAQISQRNLELLDIYNAEIWYQIQKSWAFSQEMARGQTDLEAVIIVKIMRDGEIRDIWFERRSGNSYFDDSAFKAVKKSNPLPSLPEGFLKPFYDVGFRFNLSELNRNP
jgi:colicin import membrane protein